jgi:prepilin-type N-terminal cleavage/methylation domain-containing protein
MSVTRLRTQNGFSLPELLMAMLVGIIVLIAAFSLIDNSVAIHGKVVARQDATQRGRAGMDEITRALRSAVCGNTAAPIVTATSTQVVFTTDLGDGTGYPDMRTFTYDGTADTIAEAIVRGTLNSGNVVWTGTAQTRNVVTDTDPDPAVTPAGTIFSYYAFTPGTSGQSYTPLASPVTGSNLARIARIDISYVTRGAKVTTIDGGASNFEDTVTLRSVDPDSADPKTTC